LEYRYSEFPRKTKKFGGIPNPLLRSRVGGFENAAAEKSENGLLVPLEEFAKGVGRTLGKHEHELFIADAWVCRSSRA